MTAVDRAAMDEATPTLFISSPHLMADKISSSSMSFQQNKHGVEEPSVQQDRDSGLKPIPLQRRRVWRACESCRKKKIKCDGNEPVCTQCINVGTQCTWVQTKDRAALSRQYVQDLEARLHHMEEIFKQIAPVVEVLGDTPDGASVQAIVSKLQANGGGMPASSSSSQSKALPIRRERKSSELSNTPSPRSSKSGEEDASVSEAFGQLALDEHGHPRWIGGSSTMSLIQSFHALTTSPLHRVSPMDEDPLSPEPSVNKLYFPGSVSFGKTVVLPHPEEVSFPPRELADKLVGAYFSKLHFLFPVVDKLQFLKEYNDLMDHINDVSQIRKSTPFIALVFAVFACAARIVEDTGLSEDAGMDYYERALILHYISHASIQIAHVQCFVLLSTFLCAVNCLPQAWLLIGQAVRMTQDLGLHRTTRLSGVTGVSGQVRKKVFWCVYTLDRMLALTLGRPIGILDSDCDAELPDPYDDDELQEYFSGKDMQGSPASLMQGFIALCELYRIAGRVCQQIYGIDKCKDNLEPEKVTELVNSAQELDRELVQWVKNLPLEFKSSFPGAPARTEAHLIMGYVLCIPYYAILVTLHRPFLPITPNFVQGPPALAQRAISSVMSYTSLAQSVKNVVPPSLHSAFFLQQLFTIVVIKVLLDMRVGKDASDQSPDAETCIKYVAAWEGVWPGARKCRELLSDLVSKSKAGMTNEPNQQQSPGLEASIPHSAKPASPPITHVARSESRTNRGKNSRAKSRESRASLNRTTSPYRRRNGSSVRRALEDYDRKDSGAASPTSPTLHSAFPPTYQSMTDQKPILVDNQSTASNDSVKRHSVSFLPDPVFGPPMPPPTTASSSGPSLSYSYSQQDQQIPWSPEAYNGTPFSPDADYASMFGQGYDPYTSASPFGAVLALPGQGESPPTSSFAPQGLPFPALDYIRNYGGNGFDENQPGQDQFWQVFDNSGYRFDMDMSFPLGDLPPESAGHQQEQHLGG